MVIANIVIMHQTGFRLSKHMPVGSTGSMSHRIGSVLTEKGGEVGMIALILSIIAFVIAVVNLIFVTRR